MIEIRHLRLIKEIVDTGNLTAAAKKLHLTQPSLSHQLKEIESRLGVPLFLRINKTMRITRAGERMLSAAQAIIPQITDAEKEIKNSKTDHHEIRVATHCYTCYHWLPLLMKSFRANYPNVNIDIVVEAMTAPVEFLLNGRIDVGLTSVKTRDRGVVFEKLFDDEQVLLVHKSHPLARKDFVVPKDFADENLIIYKEAFERSYFGSRVLIPAGVMPSRITPMQLTEARVELVKAAMGITVLSKWLAKPFLGSYRDLVQVRITKSGFFRPWYLATLKDKGADDKLLRAFSDHLKKHQLGSVLP